MRLFIFGLLSFAIVGLASCSSDSETAKSDEGRAVAAGEKAVAGNLTYNVVDSQILTQLGEEASPRVPRERFLLVQIAVTNDSNVDSPIPAVELVGDSGKTYSELTDGAGVANWLGVIRHVGSGRTERGVVVFDAPAAHYKLRFSDESMNAGVLADLPLTYAHETDAILPLADLPDATQPTKTK